MLPHEMTHSWNGKYRRPAGLATPDFHEPMKGELLWLYEGLADYLGIVLTARSGLWTSNTFREYLAFNAALLESQAGRQWRPLARYMARPEGAARRWGTDFYEEGDLIWLEADVLIRQRTQGRHSLEDFCRKFLGRENSPPKVVPYAWKTCLRRWAKLQRTIGANSFGHGSMSAIRARRWAASKVQAGS